MKQVLLLGDSIRMGYCGYVKELLSDRMEVLYPAENCRSSQNILIGLSGWSQLCQRDKVSVVHFNCGHWDAAHFNYDPEPLTSVEEYQKKVRSIVFVLKQFFPKAQIIFATTTPMNPQRPETNNPRSTEDIIRYNDAAKQVLNELDVAVNDLFAVCKGWNEDYYIDYCHLTEQGYRILAEYVKKAVETYP